MKHLFLFLFLGFTYPLLAQQFSKDFWHKGEIYTFSGQTIEGDIMYDLEKQSVQLRLQNGTIQSLSSQKLEAFQFFDALEARQRIFYTLPYSENNNYSKPMFFELLSEGKVNLLTREFIRQRSVPDMFYGGWMRTVYSIEDAFFVLSDEKVTAFDGEKQSLKELMKNKWTEIERFMKEKRLGTQKRSELIQLFNFYNSLF